MVYRCAQAGVSVVVLVWTGMVGTSAASAQSLFGITFDTGTLVSIDAGDGTVATVGQTGVSSLGSLDMGRDGMLYSVRSSTRELYRIDPVTGAATLVGGLGVNFQFEGGLAIVDETTAYTVGGRDTAAGAALFRVDLITGAAVELGSLGIRDVSGLTVRSDGMLVGYSHISATELFSVDPVALAVEALPESDVFTGGPLGGLTGDGQAGFLIAQATGRDAMYVFDLFTGIVDRAMLLDVPSPLGISGLAVPVPSGTVVLLGAGMVASRRRR